MPGEKLRIAFIGGTGFIGQHAVKRAIACGHAVAIIHRGHHTLDTDLTLIESFITDRADTKKLNTIFKQWQPDVIVDTIAMTDKDAEQAVSAIVNLDIPVVVLSSQDVYAQFGHLHGHPCQAIKGQVDESSELTVPYPFKGMMDDGDTYDKKNVEKIYQQAWTCKDIPAVTILRLPATYGPNDPYKRFDAIIEAIKNDVILPCKGQANWRWTHAHVDDVAHAIILAAEQLSTKNIVYNVGEPETPTMYQRFEKFAIALGKKFKCTDSHDNIPSQFYLLDQHPNDFVADDSKIRKELGFVEITTEYDRVNSFTSMVSAPHKVCRL